MEKEQNPKNHPNNKASPNRDQTRARTPDPPTSNQAHKQLQNTTEHQSDMSELLICYLFRHMIGFWSQSYKDKKFK